MFCNFEQTEEGMNESMYMDDKYKKKLLTTTQTSHQKRKTQRERQNVCDFHLCNRLVPYVINFFGVLYVSLYETGCEREVALWELSKK
jgi:hypothetical protein